MTQFIRLGEVWEIEIKSVALKSGGRISILPISNHPVSTLARMDVPLDFARAANAWPGRSRAGPAALIPASPPPLSIHCPAAALKKGRFSNVLLEKARRQWSHF